MTKPLRNARSCVVMAVTDDERGSYAAAMAPDPEITRPALGWFLLLDGGLVALAALVASPSAYARASAAVPLPPRDRLKVLLAGATALHVGEAIAARRAARRHGLPARRWAGQTLVVGFPSLLALRRTIAERRPELTAG